MKAIVLSPSNGVGGVETFCRMLRACLEKHGWNADIISPPQGVIAKVARWAGLGPPMNGFLAGRAAQKAHYDLLVTNGFLGWNVKRGHIVNVQHGTFAASAERIDKKRNPLKWFIKRFVWGRFEKKAARHAGAVVAVSEDTKRSVERYYKTPVGRVIENAADIGFFQPTDKNKARGGLGLPLDKKVVLFVGRMEYAKGGDVLEKLMDEMQDTLFLMAIGNDWRSGRTNVKVFTAVPHAELPPFYAAADIFVFPSRHEGCALAVIEAMSCGLPCVLSDVGHALDIEHNDVLGKYVVPIKDAGTFAGAVKNLLTVPEAEREAIGRAARNYALEHNSLDGFCRAYNDTIS